MLAGRRCLCPEWHGELLIVHHHWQHSYLCACSRSKVPIAPMGFSHVLHLCLQGGGVWVSSGSVSFSSSTITGNSAGSVRAHAQKFPSPRWENCCRACLDSRLNNCERFGQLQSVRAETFKSSHRPDGIFTCFALVLAGLRCLCPEWHGELLIVHHHWQHSYLCACSRSKVPIAPMGDSHFARCLQNGGVFVQGGSVTFDSCTIAGNTATYVRAHPQNFP